MEPASSAVTLESMFGDGTQTKSYLYINDFIEAMLLEIAEKRKLLWNP